MSEHLVRVENLRALQRARGWNDSDLARHCRRTPQQIRSWFVDEDRKDRRQIGEKLARSIEEQLGLAPFALDARPDTPHGSTGNPAIRAGTIPAPLIHVDEASASWPAATRTAREKPVVVWAQLAAMLEKENAALRARAPHLETFATSSDKAKFAEVLDDSMSPMIDRGDHVLLDPVEVPRAGDVVLVRIANGEVLLREFRPRTAHSFEAVPTNPAYLSVSSTVDAATVVAVMVEHRRYRRRR